MARYVCIRKCVWGRPTAPDGSRPPRRMYDVGDTEEFGEQDAVPRHFVLSEQYQPPVPPAAVPTGISKAKRPGVRAPIDPDKAKASNPIALGEDAPGL